MEMRLSHRRWAGLITASISILTATNGCNGAPTKERIDTPEGGAAGPDDPKGPPQGGPKDEGAAGASAGGAIPESDPPSAGAAGAPSQGSEDGSDQILGAGSFALEPEVDHAVSDKTTEQVVPEDIPGSTAGAYVCTTEKWEASDIRELTDRTALDQGIEILYPGALIQGAYYEQGGFSPITIPRAGGKIFVSGLKLDNSAQYSRDLPEIGAANVKQAIEDILSSEVQGTAAEASFSVQTVYSEEHLLFTLGLDARFTSTKLKTNLSFKEESKKNRVLMKFTQKYYDAIFETPETPVSVFQDGAAFADTGDQISPDNPPLYVSKVSFGRMVFFLAESEYNAEQIEASLRASYSGVSSSVELETGLTHGEILSKTSIHYYVRGGDAGLALAPISSGDATTMYDAVRNFIADKNAANYSAQSPGVPIAYTLNYLKDNTIARMSYNVTYDKQDCKLTVREPVDYEIVVYTSSEGDSETDDKVTITITGENGKVEQPLSLPDVDDRRRGKADIYRVTLDDLGELQKVYVSKDGDDGWRFDEILITNLATDEVWAFTYGDWLDSDVGDVLSVELEAERRRYYKIQTTTSTESKAETDDEVFIDIQGSLGSTGETKLDDPSIQDRKNGSVDEYVLPLREVGIIEQITVSKSGSDGWRFTTIEVTPDGEATSHFVNVDNLLLDNSGEYERTMTLTPQ
jgi:Thiol-activated cytolysin/PLAT/LH2 domain